MSEFALYPHEELPLDEFMQTLRDRAQEFLGKIATLTGLTQSETIAETGEYERYVTYAKEDDDKKDDNNGSNGGNGNGGGESTGHDPSKCTATVCSACGKGGGGSYFSAVHRKPGKK